MARSHLGKDRDRDQERSTEAQFEQLEIRNEQIPVGGERADAAGRVGQAQCCAWPPSEPDVRVSSHPAQASPKGSRADRSAGTLSSPAVCR